MSLARDIMIAKAFGGGSGGGGGGSDVFVVHIDIDYDHMTATFDKTFEEISSAVSAGKVVLGQDQYHKSMWLSFFMDTSLTFDVVDFASMGEMWVRSVNGDYEGGVLSGTYYEYGYTLTPIP